MFSKRENLSPLMRQYKSQDQLSLKNLSLHIPRMREGKEARATLNRDTNKELPSNERENLWNLYRQGEDSKEKLVLMALPLIHTIASKELDRRSAWNSRIGLEEMIQEGIGGFLRGLEAYNLDGNQKSATNYLGQWITSDIRRHIEKLDHDFTIPHETSERYRKIRAIRSALSIELNRTPTDEEIIDRANDAEYKPKNKMGKVNKSASVGRLLTQKHLDEERAYSTSIGAMETLTTPDEDSGKEYERNYSPLDDEAAEETSQAHVDENSAHQAMTDFFEKVFARMKLGKLQEKIIRQKFGLAPYYSEIPAVGIAESTQLSKYKINQVLNAFTQEMASPGGIFHAELSKLSYDERDSVNMAWVSDSLGEYPQGKAPKAVDLTLIQDMTPTPKVARKSFGSKDRVITYNHIAYYQCVHEHISTIKLISQKNAERALEACKKCGAPVQLLRTEKIS